MALPRRVIRHAPNLLSGLRLALAVVFALLPPSWRLAAVLAGGASDLLDGWIARRCGVTSVSGALLDAIADKLLVLSVLLTLAADGVIGWWQVPLVLARDLTVAAVAAYTALTGDWGSFRRMVPRVAGKVTTLVVFAWFATLLAPPLVPVAPAGFLLAAACSVGAGADYLVQFARELRRRAEDRS